MSWTQARLPPAAAITTWLWTWIQAATNNYNQCLFACWLVGLSAGLHKTYWMDFSETWMEDESEQTTLTFGTGTDPGIILLSALNLLREDIFISFHVESIWINYNFLIKINSTSITRRGRRAAGSDIGLRVVFIINLQIIFKVTSSDCIFCPTISLKI